MSPHSKKVVVPIPTAILRFTMKRVSSWKRPVQFIFVFRCIGKKKVSPVLAIPAVATECWQNSSSTVSSI